MLLRNILRRWLLLMQLLSSAVQLCPYGKSGTDVVHLTEECDQGILSWKSSYSIEEVILEYTCDNSSTTKNITAGTIRATTSSSYSSIPIDGQECTYFGCVVEEYGDPTHLLNTVTCTKKPSPTATATTPTPQSMITPTAFNNARTTQFLTTQTVRASTFTITPTTLQNVRSVSVNMLEGSPTVVGEPKKVVTSLFPTSGSNETSRSGSGSLGMTLWSSSVGPQEPINSSEGNSQLIAITSTTLEVEFKDISRTSILAMLSTLISLVIISVIILLFSLTMRLYIIRLRTQKITERQKIGLPLSSVHKLLDIDEDYFGYNYPPSSLQLSYSFSESSIITILDHLNSKNTPYTATQQEKSELLASTKAPRHKIHPYNMYGTSEHGDHNLDLGFYKDDEYIIPLTESSFDISDSLGFETHLRLTDQTEEVLLDNLSFDNYSCEMKIKGECEDEFEENRLSITDDVKSCSDIDDVDCSHKDELLTDINSSMTCNSKQDSGFCSIKELNDN